MDSNRRATLYALDLIAVAAGVAGTTLVVSVRTLSESALGVVLPTLFVSFLPGYSLIAALFPAVSDVSDTGDDRSLGGIDTVERVGLSIATSLAGVSLVGLALSTSGVGLSVQTVVTAVGGLTLLATAVAWYRRRLVLDSEQDHPYSVVHSLREALSTSESRPGGSVLTAVMVCAVVLAVFSTGYAAVSPGDREQISELYVLSEVDGDRLVATDYPREFTVGEPRRLVVGVSNREHETVSYSLVVAEQRVGGENGSAVTRQRRLHEFRPRLAHGETWQQPHELEPTLVGNDTRLVYFLYRGEAPSVVDESTAYRVLRLGVNVSARSDNRSNVSLPTATGEA